MLRRQNIGGFWRIQTKPLPPAPPPRILTQIQNLRTIPINSPASPSPSTFATRSLRDRLTQLRSNSLPPSYQFLTQHDGRNCSESTSTRQSHRTGSTDNDNPYDLSPILIRDILGQVLTYNYNNTLPSSTAANSNGQHQATVSGDIADKPPRSTPTSARQDCRSDEGSDLRISDPGDDSEARSLSPSSVHDHGDETFPYDQLLNTTYDSTSDHNNEDIVTTGGGSSDDDCGEDDDDVEDSGSPEPSYLPRHHVDDPQGTSTLEVPLYMLTPIIVGDSRPGSTQTNANQETRREVGQLNEVSEGLGLQQEATGLAQEPRLVPTILHYRAIEQFDTEDLISPINELLKQNSARFNNFLARRQAYVPTTFTPKRVKPGPPIRTTFSHAWDNQVELNFLTEAIRWLDKLLARFRAAVIHEDVTSLQPRIEQAVRDLEVTGVPSRVHSGEPLTITDQEIAQRFTDSVLKIKASNPVRKQLLGHINIDVSTFENLLSSAENIRYRRDLGRRYGQQDYLVDGLRRIYSTIVCTIPVGLSERDSIEQPELPHKITYSNDMYHPYELPDRPEIFDHPSASLITLSSTGTMGSQAAEQRLPMRQGYHQELFYDMMGTIAAQRDDEVVKIKIGKRVESMNRDWEAFYNPIYGSDMANYTEAAALRIEKEAREEMRRKARSESLQDDSRRSSTEGSNTSATSIELVLPVQGNETPPRKGNKFCMKVNKPGGCPDPNNCGAESHTNAGKRCRNGDQCKFGPGKCAYIHNASSHTNSVQPTPKPPRGGSVRETDPRLRNLLDPRIFPQAIADPKTFKVCTFVNKRQGCTAMVCTHNHTLKGYICDDFLGGHCPRGFNCVLLHKRPYKDPASLGRSGQGPKRPGLTIRTGSDLNNIDFNNPFQSGAQQLEPMDHDQTVGDRGLPKHTPTGPRSMRESVHLRRVQDPHAPHIADPMGSHKVGSRQNNRKRKGPFDQANEQGLPLIDRSTKYGRPLDEVLRNERDGDNYMVYFSDYSGDDEEEGDKRPRKMPRNGRNSHGRRGR